MAAHSIILAWEIPWTVEPSYSQGGHKKSDSTERACTHAHTHDHMGSISVSSGLYINIERSIF